MLFKYDKLFHVFNIVQKTALLSLSSITPMLFYFNQPLIENKTKDALRHINKFNLVQTMVSSRVDFPKIRNYPFLSHSL